MADPLRRVLTLLALVAIAIGSFQPFYLRVWTQDWRVLGAYLTELPYQKVPGLRRLCLEADGRTPTGARILFVAPERGYDYAFRRAQYLLAGKDVIPQSSSAGPAPDYVACVPRCSAPGFSVIWSDDRAALLKR